MLKVPNANRRKRIPTRAINAVAKHIAENFKPDKIVLFGSYAYGHPQPGSDVDLLLIVDTPGGDWPLTLAILRSLSPFRFGVDVIVRSQAEIKRRIALGDWFMEEIMIKGKVLYERTDKRVGRNSGT